MMAEDPGTKALATAEQAYVLLELGQAESALQLIEFAHAENHSKLPDLTRIWLHARKRLALRAWLPGLGFSANRRRVVQSPTQLPSPM